MSDVVLSTEESVSRSDLISDIKDERVGTTLDLVSERDSKGNCEDLTPWIDFNLICLEEDLYIKLDREEAYAHPVNLNIFLDTAFPQSEEKVEIEEGSE